MFSTQQKIRCLNTKKSLNAKKIDSISLKKFEIIIALFKIKKKKKNF